MTVAAQSTIAAARRVPSLETSAGTSTTLAPDSRGSHNSKPKISNDGVVTESKVSRESKPGVDCIEHKKLTTERWLISTPLGWPVEPDV